jgi:Uncharacterized protein conserved in bacteria
MVEALAVEAFPFLLILFVLGFVAGAGVVLWKGADVNRIRALEAELVQVQDRFDKYKQQVTGHFSKTAELFTALTDDYRSIYEHMSQGAEDLCGGLVPQLGTDIASEHLLTQTKSEEELQDVDVKGEVEPSGGMPENSILRRHYETHLRMQQG